MGVGAASAAAFAGMGLAGCAPKQAERVPSTDGGAWSWETAPEAIADIASVEEADVVVIGAGMAGMSAACSAAEKGAKVVLLEKTGAAQFRGIDYGAIGGSLQLEAGIDLRDRKEDVLQEVLRWGDHRGDYRVVKAWVDNSAEALDWASGAIDPAPHCPMYFDEGVEGLEHMPSIPLTRQPWLYLNDMGERFCNEDMPYAYVCRAHNAQPRHMKWVVWDSKWEVEGPAMGMVVCKDFRSPLHNPEQIQQFIDEGKILSANTIDELLAKMDGLNVERAKETIAHYNELCEAGDDTDFGKRKQCLNTISEPPFYGVHAGTTLLVTMGGLQINDSQQVIDGSGMPIEGLWAAGNCSGSFFFGDYPITISGASHGRACTGGRRAGQFAADRAMGV